jgi:hypothetical protein
VNIRISILGIVLALALLFAVFKVSATPDQSVDMTGWLLRDEGGNIFTFPDFTLGPGQSVKVWTKVGSNNSSNLYWNRTEPVWDDHSDCIYLRDAENNLIDSLCYNESLFQRTLSLPNVFIDDYVVAPPDDPLDEYIQIRNGGSEIPSVQFDGTDYSVNEDSATATITVTLDITTTLQVQVGYATSDGTAASGSDYSAVSDTLSFAPGETTKTFEVPIIDDLAAEPDETINLVLSSPINAVLGVPSTALLTIIDDDEPPPAPTNTYTPSPTATSTSTNSPTPTATSTPTSTSTGTPTSTSTPTATPTEKPGKLVYAPIIARSVPATPTPTPTPPVTSTPPPTSTPVPAICNGDFEQGRTCWLEDSSNGYALITDNFEGIINAHSGSWGAWLGGDYDETSIIYQQITVPTGSPRLSYWYWIGSSDFCGYDVGGVAINEDVVDGFWLCQSNNTGAWVQRTVNLSAYAGQSVTLYILAGTDGTFNSNLFIDDVQIQK